jgi:hypothetical protein
LARFKFVQRLAVATVFCLLVVLAFLYCYIQFSEGDDQGFKDFCGEGNVVRDDLQQFYKGRKVYPAYTLDQLQQMGAFDGEARAYWVHFTPFSPSTPDSEIVLRLGYGPFGLIPQLCDITFTKYDLTRDPSPSPSPWNDRLEDVKESQVKAFVSGHPGAQIISSFAWFDGQVPVGSRGQMIIDYLLPRETATRRIQYELWEKDTSWAVGSSKQLR